MPGMTVFVLMVLGWLVFNWLPGLWLLYHSSKPDAAMEAVIRRYQAARIRLEEGLYKNEKEGS